MFSWELCDLNICVNLLINATPGIESIPLCSGCHIAFEGLRPLARPGDEGGASVVNDDPATVAL